MCWTPNNIIFFWCIWTDRSMRQPTSWRVDQDLFLWGWCQAHTVIFGPKTITRKTHPSMILTGFIEVQHKSWKRKAVKWVVAWAWARRFWPWWATQASSMSWPERRWAIAQLGLSNLGFKYWDLYQLPQKNSCKLIIVTSPIPKIKDVQTCNYWISND